VQAMSLFELRSDPPALRSRAGRVQASAAAADRQELADGETAWWTLVAIALLAAFGLAAVVGTVVVTGDGVWHLIWGRALAEGTLESFATGPTPHPSLLALGAATSLLGDGTSYLVTYVVFGPLAFGVLVAAVFEVSRRLSSRWAAAVAVLILSTSVAMLSISGAARYDIAFAALVMTAVALEMARPRRGIAPLVCLAVAGLVRPEAWVLAGAYWLWLAPSLFWPARARTAALVAAAPALWVLMDVLVMGDPLYSLHVTDQGSEVLYRQYTPWENLEAAGRNVVWYLGVFPVLLLAPAAVLLGRDRPRTALPLLGALAVTLGVFLLLLSQGMASSERYLLVPACAFAILAGMAVDGGGRRTPRRVILGVFLAVILSLQVATHSDVYATVARDSASAHGRYESARALVGLPGVREALRNCPAVSLPTGKMRHWFAFYSGRAPETFVSDGKGRTRPDLYIAPGNPLVAKMALTRPRFDDDASYRVPAGLQRGPRNVDWMLYVSPTSACTSGLR
jgi:hypothetical protein